MTMTSIIIKLNPMIMITLHTIFSFFIIIAELEILITKVEKKE